MLDSYPAPSPATPSFPAPSHTLANNNLPYTTALKSFLCAPPPGTLSNFFAASTMTPSESPAACRAMVCDTRLAARSSAGTAVPTFLRNRARFAHWSESFARPADTPRMVISFRASGEVFPTRDRSHSIFASSGCLTAVVYHLHSEVLAHTCHSCLTSRCLLPERRVVICCRRVRDQELSHHSLRLSSSHHDDLLTHWLTQKADSNTPRFHAVTVRTSGTSCASSPRFARTSTRHPEIISPLFL